MKRYIFTILRGVGYGIGFALISFLFNSCDVHALSPTTVAMPYDASKPCINETCYGPNTTIEYATTFRDGFKYYSRDNITSAKWTSMTYYWNDADLSNLKIGTVLFSYSLTNYIENKEYIAEVNGVTCQNSIFTEPIVNGNMTTAGTISYECKNVPFDKTFNGYRLAITLYSTPLNDFKQFYISTPTIYGDISQEIVDKQDDTNNKLNDINDSITSSNVDDSSANSFFNNFNSDDFGLSGIISAPLLLIQQFNNNSCTPLQLSIKGKSIELPCGQTFFNRSDMSEFVEIYNIIMGGLIAYGACIGIYKKVNDFKNPDNSKVEVLDL